MFDMISHTLERPPVLSDRQREAMQAVAAELDRLNAAIRQAVDAGVAIELQRSERYHCGQGCWGDVMKPVIVKCH
jgi:hypothetical protein